MLRSGHEHLLLQPLFSRGVCDVCRSVLKCTAGNPVALKVPPLLCQKAPSWVRSRPSYTRPCTESTVEQRHRASVCNTVCVTMKLWRSVRTVTMSFGAIRTINQHHWIGSIGSPTFIHMMTLTYRRIWDWLQVKGQGHTAHTTRKCLSALTY